MAPPREPFQIPSLDGIRALAITIVLVAHAGLAHIVPGGFGVTVFFFLSGFLITTLTRREFAKRGRLAVGKFYVRRIIRIFPPFYLALLLAILLTHFGVLKGPISWEAIAYLAGHIGNYAQLLVGEQLPQGTHVYWSLAVEEHFYLTFPLFAGALLRKGSRAWTVASLVSIGLLVLGWRIWLVQHGASSDRTYLASDTRMDSILWGCVLAFVQNPMLDKPMGTPWWLKVGALATAGALIIFSLLFRDPFFRETFRYTLQSLCLVPFFYLATQNPSWPVFRCLQWEPLKYLGRISYTLYLVHHTLLYAMENTLTGVSALWIGTLGVSLSIAVASFSYHQIELPLGRFRKKFR